MKVWVLLTCIDEWSRADPNPKGKTLVFSTIENVYHYLKDEMAFKDDESVFLDRMKENDHDWRQWMVDDGHRIVARHSFSLQRYDVDAYYDELQARKEA